MKVEWIHLMRDFLKIVGDERLAWRCVLVVALREKAFDAVGEINREILNENNREKL